MRINMDGNSVSSIISASFVTIVKSGDPNNINPATKYEALNNKDKMIPPSFITRDNSDMDNGTRLTDIIAMICLQPIKVSSVIKYPKPT